MIGNSELRSLDPAALALIIAKRDAQQRMFNRVVDDGVARGVFTTTVPREAARFIVTACTAVAVWFRQDGPLKVEEIIARYQETALQSVGYQGHK